MAPSYAQMQAKYNVEFTPYYVYPIAFRDPDFFAKAPEYRYLYDPMDMQRSAEFHGVPYHIDTTGKTWIDPVVTKDVIRVAPKEKQIYIYRLYSISTLIQTEHPEKSMEWATKMHRKIYDGTASMTWPNYIPDMIDSLGLDGKAIEEKAKKNIDKYLQIVEDNHTH